MDINGSDFQGRVFVTGGNGKIGRHLVGRLLELNFYVNILCRREDSVWKGYESVRIIRGDLSNVNALKEGLENCDYVFHLAAYQNLSDKNRGHFYQTNVEGIDRLLRECSKVSLKKIVNVSSVVVFDDTGSIERDETWNLRQEVEGDADLYASTKYDALQCSRSWVAKREEGVPLVTVFPTTVVDLRDFEASQPPSLSTAQKFIWEKFGGGIPGGLVLRIGNWDRILNYVLVQDLVEGLILAAVHGKAGEEYVLGGHNLSARDYLKTVARRAGRELVSWRVPLFPIKVLCFFDKLFKVHPLAKVIVQKNSSCGFFSSEKAGRELGYQPKHKL